MGPHGIPLNRVCDADDVGRCSGNPPNAQWVILRNRFCLHVATKAATVWDDIYEWDEAKNRANSARHGLDFADAELVLNGPCFTFVDDRFDYGEKRFITLGLLAGRAVIIVHAPRGDDITRIISMRKANRREQEIYKEQLGPS